MTVVIALLRGVNVGGHQKLNMEALRTLCGSLGLRDAQTYVQSGNVVFREDSGDPVTLARRLENGIEQRFGFRPGVMVRTSSEMREVIAGNPFAAHSGIDPSKLLVSFMASAPAPQARDRVLAMPCAPEELRIHGRELYVYYPNGMARPKISMVRIEKTLQRSSTGRNWNTVTKLMAMAEMLEALQLDRPLL